ncbi:uncharacterized protein FFB20_07802 [Fusarium fujikuroi]|nr:uncharacterized protein FFE2_03387 [Fusarium fujikuroi]SCN77918.1 uncharacterized protein FFM5_01727 [Fusarium fujikuroi]SCN87074.1 uncharacterized protein FFB20_07802 [Fusarium fujikuroi]SCN94476.1 uncharacterized protein FFC1_06966 [Fusarium fujikuroi]SCO34143.1 uncharacterized protein FFMR_03366 [Fusarium fujikuroi]
MCRQVIRVASCWLCNSRLEPFGRFFPCGNVITAGKKGCGILDLEENVGPGDLLCHVCLRITDGENKLNENQKLPESPKMDGRRTG